MSIDQGSIDCNGDATGNGQPFVLEVGDAITCSAEVRAAPGSSQLIATFSAEAERAAGQRAPLDPVVDAGSWYATASGLDLDVYLVTRSPGSDANGDGVLDAGPGTNGAAPTEPTGRPSDSPTSVDDAPLAGGADATANHLAAEGEPVWWLYEVTNRSSATIDTVTVALDGDGTVCAGLVLAPGATGWCVNSARAEPAGQSQRIATATGIDSTSAVGIPVAVLPVNATAHLYVPTPGLAMTLLADGLADGNDGTLPIGRDAGSSVSLTYLVENAGDLAFTSVLLSDDTSGVIDCPELTVGLRGLQPGETVRCSASVLVPSLPDGAVRRIVATAEGTPVALGAGRSDPDATADAGAGSNLPVVTVEGAMTIDPVTAGVSKRVWIDADADRQFDEGETPVEGLSVTLNASAGPVSVTSTDASGRYRFTDLAPGVYAVEFQGPPGFADATVFADRGVLVGGRGVTDPVLLDGTNDDPGWDVPLLAVADVADAVWADDDGDGMFDRTESGIDGVTIVLRDGSGAAVSTSLTDESGSYRFTEVPPGVGVADAIIVDDVAIVRGGAVTTTSATVSGAVWDDIDGDGRRPVAEPASSIRDDAQDGADAVDGAAVEEFPAAGVIVSLVDDDAVVAMTETDGDGIYRFRGVPEGRYTVVLGGQPAAERPDDLTSTPAPTSAPTSPATSTPAPTATKATDTTDGTTASGATVDQVSGAGFFSVSPSQQVSVADLMVSPGMRRVLIPDADPIGDDSSVDDRPDWLPAGAAELLMLCVFISAGVIIVVSLVAWRRRRLTG